ncbi:MAG: hypothetical protein ACYS1A_02485 [Planctomycetota bacterium]|jgi:hypothetical protein
MSDKRFFEIKNNTLMNYRMDKFIRKAETVILWMLFGTPLVLICFAAGGFISVVLFDEKHVLAMALGGLAVGIILDAVFLRRPIKNAYRINNKILIALYIFYSIGALGFCMGVPILNFGVGIVAGFYTARKMQCTKADQIQRNRNIKRTAIFSAVSMMAMCCLTGTWALVGGMVGSESELFSFTFTAPIIIAMVIAGGLLLSLLQYYLTTTAAKITFKLSR